ncbi:MAG: UvrD-helicase domain-containing protein [Dehalococcoidia bacterium]|jgi:ATP-dependent helicase/nuclease subunit A
MNNLPLTADHASRRRISENLQEGLFVEAGAGTGKTTEMVSRIVNLIRQGVTTIDRLAAITFTEMAAAELRDRVRRGLEEYALSPGACEEEKKRCREAAADMDGASIQTLHSFAASLLRERPLEAGLPPNFRIAEPIEADIRFEDKWQSWLHGELLTGDTALELLRLIKLGLKTGHLRAAAIALQSNYDRIGQPFDIHPAPPRRAVAKVVESLPLMQKLCSLCLDESDNLYQHMQGVLSLGAALSSMQPSDDYALMALARGGKLKQSRGDRKKWGNLPSGENACSELKALLGDLEEARQAEIESVKQAGLAVLLEKLRLAVLAYADERRAGGVAEFHDLLVWARDTLRDNASVRKHFQHKYSRILIDEFQDTDPIQAEIAFYLTSGPAEGGRDLAESDWKKLSPLPGRLFVVGDPKQSIYRFRRADIATVDTVRGLMAAGSAPLTHNFRSQHTIIAWVNHVFQRWMVGREGVQPPYMNLEHAQMPPESQLERCVKYIGGYVENERAAVRRREAQEVALLLQHIRTGGWQVRGTDGALRDAEFRDVCILMPSRTGLAALERQLSEARVPYRIESESFILGTQDVKELLNCLRAIDSPADQVALVGALRSSAFACSDEDLLLWVEGGGRLDYIDPGRGEGIVRDALATLQSFHVGRGWLQADRLIENFIEDRRLSQSAYGRSRPREKLRRLQAMVDLARAYARVEGSSLRGFLDWMDRRAEEGSRMEEAPVPEADEDAVRIMTVHAAKGLEFPIVIMLGLDDRPSARFSSVIFDRSGGCEVRLGSGAGEFKTAGYDGLKDIEREAEEAERVRLKYVAATRARDHLVLSLYHSSEKTDAAAILGHCEGAADLWGEIDLSGVTPFRPDAEAVADEKDDGKPELDRWKERRALVLAQSSRPAAVAVTDLVKMSKEEAEGGEVYYRTGRGGSSLGRAVHSVLQSIDLSTGAGMQDFSRAQAAAEGIAGRWQEVAKMAGNGLQSDIVRRAVASGNYHREVFISAAVDGRLLEGIMDIIFEEEDGLVIADYKTDAIDKEDELLEKRDIYELQAGLYALMAQEATGRPVKQVVLLFLRTKKEIAPGDIDRLIAEARTRVAGVK